MVFSKGINTPGISALPKGGQPNLLILNGGILQARFFFHTAIKGQKYIILPFGRSKTDKEDPNCQTEAKMASGKRLRAKFSNQGDKGAQFGTFQGQVTLAMMGFL